MRKLGIVILVLTLWACSRKDDKTSETEKRIEITPFKINKILLRDTQSVKTAYFLGDSGRMSITQYQEDWDKDYKFLDNTSFSALRKAIWALVRNPGSRVFVNPMANASTPQEVKDRIVQCAMIEESSFDAEGNEIIQSRMNCESMSSVRNINQISCLE